ncbi:MAG: ABC transporter permease [Pseudomonadota bacterium]
MTLADTPPPSKPGTANRFRMARTVSALILREMGSRYGRSPGGYIWAVLEPMSMIAILSLGFALIARSPPLGTSFILFFGVGFAPFSLYQSVAMSVARSLIFSRALLTYPVVTWVDAVTARFLLNMLTGLLVMALVLTMIILSLEDPILIDLQPVVDASAMAILFSLGIGTLNCALIGLISVWDKIWGIINRPLFLVSGIIFLYEDMPPLAQDILWYNPLVHIVGMMRSGFYPTYEALYVSEAYVAGTALLSLFMGVVLLRRYHRHILSR